MVAGRFAFQLSFETLEGRWWGKGGTVAGRWRDGDGTVCVPTFFATLVGRWQDGFAFGIHACMRVKLYYLVMLYYILYSCVCSVCEY